MSHSLSRYLALQHRKLSITLKPFFLQSHFPAGGIPSNGAHTGNNCLGTYLQAESSGSPRSTEFPLPQLQSNASAPTTVAHENDGDCGHNGGLRRALPNQPSPGVSLFFTSNSSCYHPWTPSTSSVSADYVETTSA